jgi:putative ABC transport system permease protein
VSHKQERARAQRAPWWQRAWLDVLLLLPVIYAFYLLRQQGSIVAFSESGGSNNSPFQNPLFLLIPSLTIFAITLLVLRILPHVMSLITRFTFRTKSIGVLMAARHLARTPSFYSAPLVLLILTFALSAFIASLAQTIDQHLFSQYFYAYGADMNLIETGQSSNRTSGADQFTLASGQGTDQNSQEEEPLGPRFFFLPVEEHLNIPGVEQVTRVGSFQTFIDIAGQNQRAVFLGVDRADFSSVSFWRDDFASVSLGELMNRLAVNYNGVLVNQDFMTQNSLEIGDSITLDSQVMEERVAMDVNIIGVVENFPTWYPREGDQPLSLLVGNLDYLFEQAEGTYPYDVWLRLSPDTDFESVVREAESKGIGVINWDAPLLDIAQDQRQPVRQGLFGVLSVGFLAAIFLTVLGFFLYSFFSFRRRFVELGVLRAIGLSSRQMTRFLAWELLFLIFTGITIGTGLGIGVSNLFIPYLQVGEGMRAQYPPFLVENSWNSLIPIYILYGLFFVVALGVLVLLLMRMRIFESVKLGETT